MNDKQKVLVLLQIAKYQDGQAFTTMGAWVPIGKIDWDDLTGYLLYLDGMGVVKRHFTPTPLTTWTVISFSGLLFELKQCLKAWNCGGGE